MSVAFQSETRGMNRSAIWTSLVEAPKDRRVSIVTPTTEEPQIKNEPKANPVIDAAAGPKTDAKEDLKPNEQPKSKDDLKSIPMADLQNRLLKD
jgi:hypothetical protein